MDICYGILTAMMVAFPPPQFDHPYTDGKLTISIRDINSVNRTCQEFSGSDIKHRVYACTIILENKNWCWVLLPKIDQNISRSQHICLRRHEIAHCNGWPANHAGAVNK